MSSSPFPEESYKGGFGPLLILAQAGQTLDAFGIDDSLASL